MIRKRIAAYGHDILRNKHYRELKKYTQHGSVSLMQHSLRVAETSLRISDLIKKLHINVHEKELVRGALLHDYFLYDWHDKPITLKKGLFAMHGFTHPLTALKNARADFALTPREQDIIVKHMFPLTLTRIPACREAWIVTIADKYSSLIETFSMRNAS